MDDAGTEKGNRGAIRLECLPTPCSTATPPFFSRMTSMIAFLTYHLFRIVIFLYTVQYTATCCKASSPVRRIFPGTNVATITAKHAAIESSGNGSLRLHLGVMTMKIQFAIVTSNSTVWKIVPKLQSLHLFSSVINSTEHYGILFRRSLLHCCIAVV